MKGVRAVAESLETRRLLAAFVVDTLIDQNDGVLIGGVSLRDAIEAAGAGRVAEADTITFAPALTAGGPATITLSLGQLTLSDTTGQTTIAGPGASLLSVSGNNASRVFNIATGVTAELSGLTITGGNAAGSGVDGYGGGIYSDGTLTIGSSTLSGNRADFYGGGIYSDANGTLTVTGSTLSGNRADFYGGGIYNDQRTLTVTSSTLSGNTADSGGGIYNQGTLTVTSSTLSGNRTDFYGGGIYNNAGSTLNLNNTLVAGNTAPTNRDLEGAVTTGGSNLIGDGTGMTGLTHGVNGNQVGTLAAPIDPKLGPLADNGGPTQTLALLAGSPAIDAGSNALIPVGVTTDQRGAGFNRIVATTVDIGAFEAHPPEGLSLSSSSVAENQPANTTVGTLTSVDSDPGETFSYSLASGGGSTDNASFSVSGNTLKTLAGFDFESKSTYSIRLKTTDAAGLAFEEVFVISIVNQVEQAPAIVGITGDSGTNPSDGVTNDATLLIGGTSEPAMRITILFDGSSDGTTTADGTGAWTYDRLAVALPDGEFNVTAVARDTLGNSSSLSATFTLVVDTAAPTVTLNQASAQGDPTNSAAINFTVVFSEPVTGFTTGDVTVEGTAGATIAEVTGSGTTYNVAVSGMTQSGTVSASVPAGVATDAAGNGNADSTSTDNTVAFDNVAPTVAIEQAVGQVDPTNGSPVNFTVVFSKAVTGFTTGDVTLAGTAGATTATVTGSGTTYDVVVSGMTQSGTVIAGVAAGVAFDSAGNPNTVSTSTDNVVTVDRVAPQAWVKAAAIAAAPKKPPYYFKVTYKDDTALKASTVGAGDIVVYPPKSVKKYKPVATWLPSKKAFGNTKTIVTYYSIPAPGGTWDKADNGVYSVVLVYKHITDLTGNAIAPKKAGLTLGTFKVQIGAKSAKVAQAKASASPLSVTTVRPVQKQDRDSLLATLFSTEPVL